MAAASTSSTPTARRRVSYIIPPPTEPTPTLSLPPDGFPRNGRTGPILRTHHSKVASASHAGSHELNHTGALADGAAYPRHRLGITSFALDTSTFLEGRNTPSGILYSGGRDGMLMAWDLNLPMRSRNSASFASLSGGISGRRTGKWEKITAGDDEMIEEEDEEEEFPLSDGDVIGDVVPSGGLRGALNRLKNNDELPYEKRWELDVGQFKPSQPAHWRQHIQAHTDWVNDMLLFNLNQTVISGSSDGTVKAWNPHSAQQKEATTIGTHGDYVRCLAQCAEKKWILSGSFDRTVKIWDARESRPSAVNTLLSPDSAGSKASLYALAADPMGHVIAAGGPERVIRTWDPRSGKRVGKLVGHTDNIRAILISEDSRYLLTGSADASIKLWSLLSPQTCIHTFTHHTESVWSLFSSHPNLETFYSGDRSGLVCRVDVEDCSRLSQGECTVLIQDTVDSGLSSSDGVSKILAMDDHLVWTASGSSSIRRWRVPQTRATRNSAAGKLAHPFPTPARKPSQLSLQQEQAQAQAKSSNPPDSVTLRRAITPSIYSDDISELDNTVESERLKDGIPYDCLVRLASPNSVPLLSRAQASEIATLYSGVSDASSPKHQTGHRQSLSAGQSTLGYGANPHRDTLGPPVPDGMPLQAQMKPRMAYEERDVAPDAIPFASEPDYICEGAHGLVRALTLNDRIHALTVDTAGTVAVWDIVRGQCRGRFPREVVQSATVASGSRGSSVATRAALDGQEDASVKKMSPRQALEIVRERIEGEAVVNAWSNVDTKIGELTVHIVDRCFESEVFADEVGIKNTDKNMPDDQRINVGKWILRNLFINFIHEEQRSVARTSHDHDGHINHRSSPINHHHRHRSSDHTQSHSHSHSHNVLFSSTPAIPAIPPSVTSFKLQHLSPIAQSPDSVAGDAMPTPRPSNTAPLIPSIDGALERTRSLSAAVTPAATSNSNSVSGGDYFSTKRRPSTSQSSRSIAQAQTPGAEDDFSGWAGPGSAKSSHDNASSTPSTPGGGLMGKLKSLGKSSRKVASETDTSGVVLQPATDDHSDEQNPDVKPREIVTRIKSQSLTPPGGFEAPLTPLPSHMSIQISEELPLSSGWSPLYTGLLGNLGNPDEIEQLEKVMPEWLLEFLLCNKATTPPITKISFVLLPYVIAPELRDIYGNTLPELLNTSQTKLTAGRFLRVKKLTHHVQDKLDRGLQSKTSTPRSSTDAMHSVTSNGNSQRTPFSAPPPMSSHSSTAHSSPRHSPTLHSHSHLHQPHSHLSHSHPRTSNSSVSISSSSSPLPPQLNLPRAEDAYEILCNDHVLPLEMTLAAVRQFVWRQSGELVMHYRRKQVSVYSESTVVAENANTSPGASSQETALFFEKRQSPTATVGAGSNNPYAAHMVTAAATATATPSPRTNSSSASFAATLSAPSLSPAHVRADKKHSQREPMSMSRPIPPTPPSMAYFSLLDAATTTATTSPPGAASSRSGEREERGGTPRAI